jgi:hypothetical protein
MHTYLQGTARMLESFAHISWTPPSKKITLLQELLALQNRLLGLQVSESELLRWYEDALLSERIEIFYPKGSNVGSTTSIWKHGWRKKRCGSESRGPSYPCYWLKHNRKPYVVQKFEELDKVIVGRANSNVFGPFLWIQLFLLTRYHLLPSETEKNFVYALFNLLPCEHCRGHSLTYYTLVIEKGNRFQEKTLFAQLLELHNKVGQQRSKPARTEKEINILFRQLFSFPDEIEIRFYPNRFLPFTS